MPQRVADHLHVAAALVKMGRGRVTQAMEGMPAVDASLVARLLEDPVQGPGLDGQVGRGTVEYLQATPVLMRAIAYDAENMHRGARP